MTGFSERFREALDNSEETITSVSEKLHAKGVRGHTRNAIYAYLRGESSPSVEFVKVVAPVLDVRSEWLAFGTKPREHIPASPLG